MPDELKKSARRLEEIKAGTARLEAMVGEKAIANGEDADEAPVPERAAELHGPRIA
jgi:hypothetical protein